jgi:hypothetical protein
LSSRTRLQSDHDLLPANPYLAEHVEQHVTAQSDDSGSEFEFGLGLILDGLKRAR